ncbi:MAG: zinc metalloprotease HtpX [Candidatus Magasanikbacteria bacterium RIFOXYC2_FULL_42_28]|uniref:Protease HtpX homolog n=1 Tax=Candidatus Magasanikbacteria bacterium RIFOXYC2_FULL_42_28 TaxID=1798704 RepID=A0A1F6NV79_9BACT|nr:MAG: zinc metalloprotease HtpX [Candidatus Magasanikbacteria bacterium RIFOXYC2_FULL_42_28]
MYSEIASNKRKSVLLVIIFIAIIIGLGFVFDSLYGVGNYSGVSLAIIFSLLMTSVSYFHGDKIALATSGAKQIVQTDNPYLYRLVENLCITVGTSVPKVYIITDPAINAFATGRDPAHASIAVTTGAIEKLTNEELEGVLAHELSHVKNYDIRFMMLVAVLVGAIAILSNIMLRSRIFRGRDNDNRGGQLGGILMIAGIVLAILSPIIAEIIKLAISRKREYLADASGALLTRFPDGLANALEKIANEAQPMANASQATAHLFIANPFGSGKKFSNLFSTHPPVEERIKRLREMGK